jgi:septum site-determining protein MinC
MTRPPAEKTTEGGAMWIGRTLRSGTRVEFAGNVIVVGDVNPGAEVVAEGNVIVWGRVRGLVHAGAGGDASAFVCGLDLSAAQIRVGGVAAVPSERSGEVRPVKYFLEDGIIKSESWQSNQS